MSNGVGSFSTTATVYGRRPTDSYYNLATEGVTPGNLEVAGNLKVDGTSEFVGAVVMDGDLTVNGGVNMPGLVNLGSTTMAAFTSTGNSQLTGGASLTITSGNLAVTTGTITAGGTVSGSNFIAANPTKYYRRVPPSFDGSSVAQNNGTNSGGVAVIFSVDKAPNPALFGPQGSTITFTLQTANTDQANNYSLAIGYQTVGSANPAANVKKLITPFFDICYANSSQISPGVPTGNTLSFTFQIFPNVDYVDDTVSFEFIAQGNAAYPATSLINWGATASIAANDRL